MALAHNIQYEITRLVPASIANNIACFVFYDNHPRMRHNNLIDITICTKSGELKEFYKKKLVSSVHLNSNSIPTEIQILRNANAELFYLIYAGDEITITSRLDKLQIHKKVYNVDKYEIEDAACRGQACLKVFCKDDAMPLIFDDNFETLNDGIVFNSSGSTADDSLPIITQLSRKLTEAKYSVKCNEATYKELLQLRQLAAFSTYQSTNPNLDDSIIKSGLHEVNAVLKIKTAPWIKTVNKRIAIVLEVFNQDSVPLEDIHALIHNTETQSIVYTTKLFEKTNLPPFWREKKTHELKPQCGTAVVIIIDLKEIKYLSKIEFKGVLCYKRLAEEYVLPFDNVIVSTIDTMGEEFDVLHNPKLDEPNTLLAILATTEHTELLIRHIKTDEESDTSIADMLCTHLQMERVPHSDNIVIHRKSPYHTLNGVMVVINEVCEMKNKISYSISVYSRSSSQILALIHYIYNEVPANLIVTTQNIRLTAKVEQFCQYNEDTQPNEESRFNSAEYVSSMLKRTAMVLEHLDYSMIKMNESKNPTVQSKVGKEIDLFAGGVASYLEFRNKMLEEGVKGVENLFIKNTASDDETEVMIVD